MNFYQIVIRCLFRKVIYSFYQILSTDGKFGAMMEVNIKNSGPVTLEIESPLKLNESNQCNDTQ